MAKRVVKVDNKSFEISYDIFNLERDKSAIFLHGWGSSKEVMKVFKDELKEYKHIYIDMAGFGNSPTDEVLTTKLSAKIVDELLKDLGIKKELIIGHSFGGKVATLLNPDRLVLLSSAGIVEKKSLKVQFKIKLFKLLKFTGLSKFRNLFVSKDVQGMSENMYQTFKNVVDEDFTEEFKRCGSRAVVFWGADDKAVSVESGKKIANLLESEFIVLKGDHFFFLDKENIKKICENIIFKIE